MTREELDFIGSMNMCDEISNEAYKKIVCHFEGQEPCEDCIRREAAIEAIYDNDYKKDMRRAIETLPSVNPQEKTGHWIETGNKGHIDVDSTILYQEMCDKCKGLSYFRKSCGKLVGAEYCPNCMAKMESEVSE